MSPSGRMIDTTPLYPWGSGSRFARAASWNRELPFSRYAAVSESATRLAWKPQLRTTEPCSALSGGSGFVPVEFGRTKCVPGEKVALKPGSVRGVPRRRVESGGEDLERDAESAFPVPRGMSDTIGRLCGGEGDLRELRSSNRRVSPERRITDCGCFPSALISVAISWIVSADVVV